VKHDEITSSPLRNFGPELQELIAICYFNSRGYVLSDVVRRWLWTVCTGAGIRGLFQGYFVIRLEKLRKITKNSSRIACNLVEIWTVVPPERKQVIPSPLHQRAQFPLMMKIYHVCLWWKKIKLWVILKCLMWSTLKNNMTHLVL